jgi:hypothetical protein
MFFSAFETFFFLATWSHLGSTHRVHPGVYVATQAHSKPVVALCPEWSAKVTEDMRIDICLTITPSMENKVPKEYRCERIPFSEHEHGGFLLDEDSSHCLLRMRKFANSVGIDIVNPIAFSYSMTADDLQNDKFMATVSFHLRWAQQKRPFEYDVALRSADRIFPTFAGFAMVIPLFIL